MIVSACRGEARNNIPNLQHIHRTTNHLQFESWFRSPFNYLSKSYLAPVICIISTAQQASPNVNGHIDPFLLQLTRSSNLARAYSAMLLGDWKGEYGRCFGCTTAGFSGTDTDCVCAAVDWGLAPNAPLRVKALLFDIVRSNICEKVNINLRRLVKWWVGYWV